MAEARNICELHHFSIESQFEWQQFFPNISYLLYGIESQRLSSPIFPALQLCITLLPPPPLPSLHKAGVRTVVSERGDGLSSQERGRGKTRGSTGVPQQRVCHQTTGDEGSQHIALPRRSVPHYRVTTHFCLHNTVQWVTFQTPVLP